MREVLNGKLVHQILSVVSCIPLGSVATYGQIAQLIGRERNARLVGRVLSQAGLYGKYPCHRVVNSAGRLAPAWEEQRHLLWAEGVTFKTNGCVDLKKHQWKPTDISKV
ncbi:MGMT family protein [Streptococcus constellatus]|uniref:MGMT family protein n=1 Tax=Streptococcus constellatus TaxID=76860 RepID=UPI00066C340B|nr:MGMT family protein [Streptococcus constellatus]MBW3452297.1 MGMT family protein [Streptococcus constellatus]